MRRYRVGVIADTHGLLRPEVFELFAGVDHILHAGDVGRVAILDDLEALAPVTAVWGNTDGFDVRDRTRESASVRFGSIEVGLVHGHRTADPDALADEFPAARVVVHGHTHLPAAALHRNTLVLNPGSAGPRRPGKPVTVALLRIRGDELDALHRDVATGKPFRQE